MDSSIFWLTNWVDCCWVVDGVNEIFDTLLISSLQQVRRMSMTTRKKIIFKLLHAKTIQSRFTFAELIYIPSSIWHIQIVSRKLSTFSVRSLSILESILDEIQNEVEDKIFFERFTFTGDERKIVFNKGKKGAAENGDYKDTKSTKPEHQAAHDVGVVSSKKNTRKGKNQ